MSLRHAILGFLSHRPLSGYDLKKAFDGSVAHFWAADQAQIYRTLAGLSEERLVEVERVAQEVRPDRKLHHLTASGRAELVAWLQAPTVAPARREPLLVKLFFVSEVAPEHLGVLLRTELVAAERELATLNAVATGTAPAFAAAPPTQALGPALTLWAGLAATRAWRDWLVAALGTLEGDAPMAAVLAALAADA